MSSSTIQRVRRFLRSPALITTEIVVITLAGVIGASFPQASTSGGAELAWLRDRAPALTEAGLAVGLDHVFQSVGFLCAVVMAAFSLLIVVIDQSRNVRRAWPVRGPAAVGAPLLHIGLLLVLLAGGVRLLFSSQAVVDLMEGESLPPDDTRWGVQKPGRLAAPIHIAQSIGVGAVEPQRYPSGDLRQLAVRLTLNEPGATRPSEVTIPVNGSLALSGTRLFVGSDYGPSALIEWQGVAGRPVRTAALLKHEGGGRFETVLNGPGGERAYLRAEAGPGGNRPEVVEIRVMKGDALIVSGDMPVGASVALPSGGSLVLRGLPFWVRLHASRDPSLWLIYAGLACVAGGLTLLFAFVRRDARAGVKLVVSPQPVFLLLLACVAGLTGCRGVSHVQARRLVEHYNAVVSEAYRRGDVKRVDGVVGVEEGRKLTGLIGVRFDMGVTLDSTLLSLEVLEVTPAGDRLQVRTRERWRYCDRRIGTGEPVGGESEDNYVMRYHFMRSGRTWLVERIEFAEPPAIGRPQALWAVAHGTRPALTNGSPTRQESPKP
ncbi:MAG: hypothetical protein WCG36_02810 [bacterium]